MKCAVYCGSYLQRGFKYIRSNLKNFPNIVPITIYYIKQLAIEVFAHGRVYIVNFEYWYRKMAINSINSKFLIKGLLFLRFICCPNIVHEKYMQHMLNTPTVFDHVSPPLPATSASSLGSISLLYRTQYHYTNLQVHQDEHYLCRITSTYFYPNFFLTHKWMNFYGDYLYSSSE